MTKAAKAMPTTTGVSSTYTTEQQTNTEHGFNVKQVYCTYKYSTNINDLKCVKQENKY